MYLLVEERPKCVDKRKGSSSWWAENCSVNPQLQHIVHRFSHFSYYIYIMAEREEGAEPVGDVKAELEEAEREDPNLHFKPVIHLDKVEVVSGEENENVLYKQYVLIPFVMSSWKSVRWHVCER